VEQAQARLARQGFYRGIVDGQLSDNFAQSLAAYQRDADLRESGRLDMDTLADMNLLPRRHVVIPRPLPYGIYEEPPGVYRGVWVH
jgi:peptidoglycan hydrolase-like protein with peptidoglycan-binding domain